MMCLLLILPFSHSRSNTDYPRCQHHGCPWAHEQDVGICSTSTYSRYYQRSYVTENNWELLQVTAAVKYDVFSSFLLTVKANI